jgi:hypothetical protein
MPIVRVQERMQDSSSRLIGNHTSLDKYAELAYKALTVQEPLDLMKKIQGEKTNTQFAAEIGISKQYLTDIYNGRKVPSDTVSAALGYTPRVFTKYFPSATAANEEMPSASPPKSKATRSRKRDSR